ncbi:MAG: hypothetical protein AAFX55_18405 [Bacteroidota bacterium]
MDKYKSVFEKGNQNYIDELHKIDWFQNPYINAQEMESEIMECSFLPYLATRLRQTGYTLDFYGTEQVEHIFDCLKKVLKDLDYEINENSVSIKINDYSEHVEINFDEFEAGEGDDSFVATIINPFLNKAGFEYQFYEMPLDDETASFIFVTPEKYKTAIEKGLIPDFMGYYAVNY